MPRARAPRPAPPAVPARILVVDDAPDTLELIQRNLASQGFDVHTASGAADALALLDSLTVDLVVTDMRMPGLSGLDLIREARRLHPGIELVVITGYATVEGAVEALQQGAWDYLSKPFTDEELFQAVRRALARRRPAPPRSEGALVELHGLLGRSHGMAAVFGALEVAAGDDDPVLLCGEPGSGRETAARALHALSGRRGPFLRVALDTRPQAPDQAAAAARLDEAAAACGDGTLYLPGLEVAGEGELGALAARLAGARRPAGGACPRVVASASEEPAALRRRGGAMAGALERFGTAIPIPPLRERGEDVVLLARRFLAEAARDAGVPLRGLAGATELALRGRSWPNNVRELRHLALRLARSERTGAIEPAELPADPAVAAGAGSPGDLTLDSAEQAHIRRVLRECGGNKSRAAEVLGIDRKTLRDRLRGSKPGA